MDLAKIGMIDYKSFYLTLNKTVYNKDHNKEIETALSDNWD